jgi:hypothetical protein
MFFNSVLHFSKIFRATFLPHRTHHLQPFDFIVMLPLTAKYVTQKDWTMGSPENKTVALISKVYSPLHIQLHFS